LEFRGRFPLRSVWRDDWPRHGNHVLLAAPFIFSGTKNAERVEKDAGTLDASPPTVSIPALAPGEVRECNSRMAFAIPFDRRDCEPREIIGWSAQDTWETFALTRNGLIIMRFYKLDDADFGAKVMGDLGRFAAPGRWESGLGYLLDHWFYGLENTHVSSAVMVSGPNLPIGSGTSGGARRDDGRMGFSAGCARARPKVRRCRKTRLAPGPGRCGTGAFTRRAPTPAWAFPPSPCISFATVGSGDFGRLSPPES
jgi:hypothetical protein